ncbi:MAG: metal ABC transporter ATP-binding protein [candidate division KSB1 bacterium]|jgi:zinc transport system ATP-binding protein|nr:metal ABC transporter ATP-binding protein [candidate division KSB1 bacterium]
MSGMAVHVKDISVRFGDFLALDGLSLDIPVNAFVAIVGPNGAGKSTFLKVLLGLVEPTMGEVTLFGFDPLKVNPDQVGYVPQMKTMDRSFPALAIELVYTGINRKWPWQMQENHRDKAMEALKKVGAGHLADRPLGRLSGGELQRICLARSIVREPKLVMLDEPATGIDSVGEEDMYRMLEKFQRESNATLLMITHDWHTATHHADYVLLLNRRQISFGVPSEALAEDNLRRAFGHMGHEHELKFLVKS